MYHVLRYMWVISSSSFDILPGNITYILKSNVFNYPFHVRYQVLRTLFPLLWYTCTGNHHLKNSWIDQYMYVYRGWFLKCLNILIKINVLYLEFPHLHSFLFCRINRSLVGVFSVEVDITLLLIMWQSGFPRCWNLFHQRGLYSLFSAISCSNFNLSVMLDIIYFFTI